MRSIKAISDSFLRAGLIKESVEEQVCASCGEPAFTACCPGVILGTSHELTHLLASIGLGDRCNAKRFAHSCTARK